MLAGHLQKNRQDRHHAILVKVTDLPHEGYLDNRSSPLPYLHFMDRELMDEIKQTLALCIV